MYVPVKAIEVFIWGHRVGVLTHDYDQYSVFEYDPEFRKTGIEVAPFLMPLSKSIYHVEDFGLPRREFAGLPGMIADSLPDSFGNALVRKWVVEIFNFYVANVVNFHFFEFLLCKFNELL